MSLHDSVYMDEEVCYGFGDGGLSSVRGAEAHYSERYLVERMVCALTIERQLSIIKRRTKNL